MSDEHDRHVGTIQNLLGAYRHMAEEFPDWAADFDGTMDAIRNEIAYLDTLQPVAVAGEWEPVNRYHAQESINMGRNRPRKIIEIQVAGRNITMRDNLGNAMAALLPPDHAICQQRAQPPAPVALDMPDSPGWWAYEGSKPFERNSDELLKTVAEVTVWKDRLIARIPVGGSYFIDAFVGKWTRVVLPWDAQPSATVAPVAMSDEVRMVIDDALTSWVAEAIIRVVNGYDSQSVVDERGRLVDVVRAWLDAQPKEVGDVE